MSNLGKVGGTIAIRPNVDEKVGEVRREITELHSRLDRMSESIDILEKLLQPILRTEPDAAPENQAPQPCLVPVAEGINRASDRVGMLMIQILNISQRCEL